jgi:hypothetical protein
MANLKPTELVAIRSCVLPVRGFVEEGMTINMAVDGTETWLLHFARPDGKRYEDDKAYMAAYEAKRAEHALARATAKRSL